MEHAPRSKVREIASRRARLGPKCGIGPSSIAPIRPVESVLLIA
jgi:hypothetical protein